VIPRLHVICPDRELERVDALERIASLLEAGGACVAVHLRPRQVSARRTLQLAQDLARRARSTGGWLVVNGRSDIARVAAAQAVQLGHGSLPVPAARRVVGDACAIGVSVHGPGECREAAELGADYVLLGTVFPTPSHPGSPTGGLGLVASCVGIGCPVIGIGGIDEDSTGPVLGAGAHGVAVIRAVWQCEDPASAVHRLVRRLDGRTATSARRGVEQTRAQ